MSNNRNRSDNWRALGYSVLAAAWLIAGPDLLGGLGLQSEILIELLTFVPAMGVLFMIAIARPGFVACERRTFKRLLGIK